MFVQCTQCHRSAMVCDCPANPAGTADRITDLERQLAEANAALRKYQGSVYMSAPDKWEFVADNYFEKYPEAKETK
jgi:hypothetical protein